MSKPIRYADILAAIAQGAVWSAYVDDTGPGGNSASPNTLPHDRETHIAAVFSPAAGAELMDQMPGLLEELLGAGGETEFHFSRIYNGSGPYRRMGISIRLALLQHFADIATRLGLAFLVQSIDARDSASVREAVAASLPRTPGFLDPGSNKDISRLFLLISLKRHLLERLSPSDRAPVFLDEGWKKPGVALRIPQWDPPFYEGLLMSADSRNVWGLQFADFAGFVLTRSQMLRGRSTLTELDAEFLQIASSVAPLFSNVTLEHGTLESIAPEEAG